MMSTATAIPQAETIIHSEGQRETFCGYVSQNPDPQNPMKSHSHEILQEWWQNYVSPGTSVISTPTMGGKFLKTQPH